MLIALYHKALTNASLNQMLRAMQPLRLNYGTADNPALCSCAAAHRFRRRLAVIFLSFGALTPVLAQPSTIHPVDLRCENLREPLGIDRPEPRLSWVLETDQPTSRNQHQSAYQILISNDEKTLGANQGDMWDSGRINSSQSIHVRYAGKPLVSGQDCFWKVRIWNKDGEASAWSVPAHWQMGLLNPSDWHAKWIGWNEEEDHGPAKSALSGAQWIWFPEGKPERELGACEPKFGEPPGTACRITVLIHLAQLISAGFSHADHSQNISQTLTSCKRVEIAGVFLLTPGLILADSLVLVYYSREPEV